MDGISTGALLVGSWLMPHCLGPPPAHGLGRATRAECFVSSNRLLASHGRELADDVEQTTVTASAVAARCALWSCASGVLSPNL
jgi:hypothetical protein